MLRRLTPRHAILAADDETARRDHDPTSVLALDALDPPEPWRDRTGLDLDDAVAPFDQGCSIIDAAQHPARHHRWLQILRRLAQHHRHRLLLLDRTRDV